MAAREALQRAIAEITRQRAELAAVRAAQRAPIAIIGLGCRFPGGADGPAAFWRLLDEGGDAVRDVPSDRWRVDAYYARDPSVPGKMATRAGGFLDHVDRFDAPFFGMAPREARSLDPQQRLLLEVAWEALEHGGVAPTSLYGSATGVFVGITCFDHAMRIGRSVSGLDAYAGTGSALNMAPGRLSYVLGLTGPSMAIDTACSSSLVALHLACQSLRQRETDMALAGGVHLILSPDVMVSFSQARMLSPDGRSKTFDRSADGYSRGEGCGVVVLKRYDDAVASGDRVMGIVRGTAVNQDGPSGGLTVPSGAAQEAVIRRALEAAGLAPTDVDYVEAHGTGTSLGDPIEVEALASVYGTGRDRSAPLLIGAVKTNIGHLEPAAGMAGLAKVLLAFEHGVIPRHLHFRDPSPHIPWASLPVRVVSEPTGWPRSDRAPVAGVSAFGFSGTNAHVIVQAPESSVPSPGRAGPHLLALSARTASALVMMAQQYRARLAGTPADAFEALCFTAGAGRAHFAHRLAIVAATPQEAASALETFVSGGMSPALVAGVTSRADYTPDVRAATASAADAVARLREGAAGARDGDANGRTALLCDIAASYVAGARVEWRQLHGPTPPAPMALPTYPFERERHWIDLPDDDRDAPSDVDRLAYEIRWTEAPPAVPAPLAGRQIVTVCGSEPLAGALSAALQAGGAQSRSTNASDVVDEQATDVVYLGGLGGAAPPDGVRCAELLGIVQSLTAAQRALPRLWVVTQGAASVQRATDIAGVALAAVAGFARVISLEHPELFERLIDVDAAGDMAAVVGAVVQELGTAGPDEHVAVRDGTRYVPRVERTALSSGPAGLPVRPDAAYVITGGLGALGLRMAARLVARGARHLVLVGRHGPSSAGQRRAIAAFEAQGVTVRTVLADVGDEAHIGDAWRTITEGQVEVGGIVHAAGVGGYVDIAAMRADEIGPVLRAKAAGAWYLHELVGAAPLDFFVLFSSIASAWGSRGQAHYAAANAVLDALGAWRHAQGLPATVINWGPWRGGGMTSPEAEALLRRVGVTPLEPEIALDALEAAVASGRPQVTIADIAWGTFRGSYEARGQRRLLEHMERGAVAAPAADVRTNAAAWTARLTAAPASDRERIAIDAVRAEVVQVLELPAGEIPDQRQGLFEMGMDSLTALELRTRLETLTAHALPTTLVFEYPTIEAIGRLLVSRMDTAAAPAPPAARERATRIAPAASGQQALVEALSDADAEALLLETLDSITSSEKLTDS